MWMYIFVRVAMDFRLSCGSGRARENSFRASWCFVSFSPETTAMVHSWIEL